MREATARYRDVSVAEADGYELHVRLRQRTRRGAMGLHYVNMSLVGDGELDACAPEIVIYEPLPNGRRRLIGADFLVLAADWDAKNAGDRRSSQASSSICSRAPIASACRRSTRCTSGRGRTIPSGTFVNWHAKVSCD